jgi:hypothetical protein
MAPSPLLSLYLLKTSSAVEILVITDPNADRSVDREFDFLGSHVDVLSAFQPFIFIPRSGRQLRLEA